MAKLSIRNLDAAVVVIDCQNDLVHESRAAVKGAGGALARAVASRGVLPRTKRVLDTARASHVPVLFATIENRPEIPKPSCAIYRWSKGQQVLRPGTWGAEIHPEVRPVAGDLVLNRYVGIDPSHGSALWATLGSLNRRTLIVMGVSTNFAVEGTVRAAVNRMFDVILVEDCCAGESDDWHRFSVENILPLLATVTTSDVAIEALEESHDHLDLRNRRSK
jgi:nicotinamidase-related amidase